MSISPSQYVWFASYLGMGILEGSTVANFYSTVTFNDQYLLTHSWVGGAVSKNAWKDVWTSKLTERSVCTILGKYIGYILKLCPVAVVANIKHINEWVDLSLEI